jgi:hypothetical protein
MYGQNPAIYRPLTWAALMALTAPSLPVHTRIEIEAEIVAGRRFSHAQIRARRTTNQPAAKNGPLSRLKGQTAGTESLLKY